VGVRKLAQVHVLFRELDGTVAHRACVLEPSESEVRLPQPGYVTVPPETSATAASRAGTASAACPIR
jgi:hypothetical protein